MLKLDKRKTRTTTQPSAAVDRQKKPAPTEPNVANQKGYRFMRRPGREFGSEKPRVIYLALRWNDTQPIIDQEENMINKVAQKLGVNSKDLRIYNLVRPSKDRGMNLSLDEFNDVEETVKLIQSRIKNNQNVHRIVVGGRSGPMPMVALMLKLLIPRIRIEVRNHHKARSVNGPPLKLIKILRQ